MMRTKNRTINILRCQNKHLEKSKTFEADTKQQSTYVYI